MGGKGIWVVDWGSRGRGGGMTIMRYGLDDDVYFASVASG